MAVFKATKKAVIVRNNGIREIKKIGYTRKMLHLLGYETTMCKYDAFETSLMDESDLVVITPSDNVADYDSKGFDTLLTKLCSAALGIIGLGDSNAVILEYFGYKVDPVANHRLENSNVHNIVDAAGEEYFIPSNHRIVPVVDNYNLLDMDTLESTTDHFMDVIAVSPIRGNNPDLTDVTQEIEIISARLLRYVGIMGAPEMFFKDTDRLKSNQQQAKTMEFIKKIIDNLA